MSAEDDDKTIVSIPAPWQSQGIAVARRCPKCGLEVSDNTMVCPVDNTTIFEAPGKVLADTYEFMSVSGWGGMSVIYKARQRESGHIVAIKMLHSLLVTDQALRRFQQEAKAIMSLRHPNIITVHDFGVSEHGQPYMVMDFIEGKTLADVIKESGGLSLEASLPRFIQLCDALDHAHAVGVLHRDLKPSNVMISSLDGSFEDARIVDFGIAKLLDKEGENKDIGHLTQTGELFGSPLYMSPEQCRGTRVDARTDIYSMGCVMYETLTGRPPFMGATIVDTLMMQMADTPDSLTEASKGKRFSSQVEDVIAKTLAKSPDDRYQTMQELEMALMSIQPNKQADSQPLRTGKSKKHTPIPKFVYVAGFAFILVALIFCVWWQHYRLLNVVISKVPQDKRGNAIQNSTQSTNFDEKRYNNLKKLLSTPRDEIDDTLLQQTCRDGDLQLSRLDLNRSRVSDGGTMFLSNQLSLKKLYLDNTHVSNRTVYVVAHLPNMEKVSLHRANINDFAFDDLPQPKNLWGLYLTESRGVGDRSLFNITLLPALSELDVKGTSITDEGCNVLHRTNLKKFWATDTKFGDQGMHSLQRTSLLTDLYIGNTKITDRGLAELRAPVLTDLDISNTGVTDRGMPYLTRFAQLDSLRLVELPITDKGAAVIGTMEKLQRLNLDSTNVTDKTMRVLAKLPALRELNVQGVEKLTDNGIESLSHAQSLVQLNLTNTKITNVGLHHLVNLKTLKTLVLIDCPNVSLSEIRQFKKKRPQCGVFVIEPTSTF